MCRSEYDTLGTSIKAALVYLGTALVKVRHRCYRCNFYLMFGFSLMSYNVVLMLSTTIFFFFFFGVQLVCLATFLKVSENDSFDPYQVQNSFIY